MSFIKPYHLYFTVHEKRYNNINTKLRNQLLLADWIKESTNKKNIYRQMCKLLHSNL